MNILKKLAFISLIILLCLAVMLPHSFAAENDTMLCDDGQNDGNTINSTDYYFDVGADSDGNGSADNPYRNFTSDRIKDGSTVHLADGEYVLNKSRSFTNISFYGMNPQSTVLNGNGSVFTVNGIVNFKNITLTNFRIIDHGTLNASNTIFTELIPSLSDENSYGGAIYAPKGNIFLDNCTLFDNRAEYGGAIYISGGKLTVLNSFFYNNVAYNYGGAIAGESRARIIIKNTRFLNDSSTNDAGGAIYLVSSTLEASNSNISNCSSTFGAAITSLKSDLNLTGLILKDNVAKYEGGAIYQVYGSIILNSSKFINNSARNGGGLFLDDVKVNNMTFNEFSENHASVFAGAIYSIMSDFNLTTNDFTNNDAYLFDDVYNTSSINLTIGNGNYTMYVLNQTFNSTLPSFYDMRQYGYVTSVKDQKNGGNCWAFAAMASLESCILKATGEVLDLSEENMKNLLALYSDYGYNNRLPNDGGSHDLAIGYLVSWLGPVNESDDMYDDKSHISPVLNSLMHIQNVLYLTRKNATDNDAIKHAIMNYGAVATSMYFGSVKLSGGKVYHYYTGSESANHAVTIVGWDDDFVIPDAPGKGAWIAKNSWGPSWYSKYNMNGYFYISYYDVAFARPGTYSSYTFILNDTLHFDKNYQYDLSGHTDYFYYQANTVGYENAFYATDDEFLAAVSTYFNKDTEWQLNIYVNSRLQLHQNGSASPGYFTINLDYPVPLMKGDLFEVMFIIKVEGDVAFPISEYISLNKLTYSPNISFVSFDGIKWLDLYDFEWYGYPGHSYLTQVACIKGFTQLITLNASIRDLNVTYDSFDLFNITAYLTDENNNSVRNGNVTFNVNGVNHTAWVYNGIASIQLPLNLGLNNISAAFSSPNYCSADANTTFEVLPISLDMNITVIQDFNNAYINFTCSQAINETVLIRINDQNMSVELINGTYQLNLTTLDYGNYIVEASVDSDFYNSSNSTSFFVNVKKTHVIVDDLTTIYNSGEFVSIKLVDEFGDFIGNCSVEYVLNNVICLENTDGEGRILVPVSLGTGNYTLSVTFKGNSLYVNSTNSSKITVNPSNTTLSIVDISYDSFDVFNITVNVWDQFNRQITNGTLIITVNNADYEVNVTESVAKIQRSFTVGRNNISAVFIGDDYISSSQITQFDVLPVALGLVISVQQDFNNACISFLTSQLVNETLFISVNGQNRSVRLVNGAYEMYLTTLDYGNYAVEAELISDFYTSQNSTSFFVNVKRTSIEVSDMTTTYNSGEFLQVRLLDQFDQPVADRELRFSIDGKAYYTDANGSVLIPVSLKDAVYEGIVSFDGDDLYVKSQNASTITVKSTVILPELKDYALNSNYVVYLLNKDGNPLNNTLITFTFNNNEYNVVSDENGKATFTVPVSSGKYSVTVSNPISGQTLSQSINVLNRITENKNINAYYGFYPTYNIRVRNDDGKFAGNLEVKITVNKKVYKLHSDKNGYVSLKIYLTAGNYVITSEYKGFKVSNKITIKPTLITKNIKAKKGKTVKFTAKLLDKNGKVLKGKKITFKVKGKTYKAKTNKKGIATIKIKNLKAGNYNVVSLYGKLKSTSKITIKK